MPTYTLVGTAAGATGAGDVTPTMPTYAAGDLAIAIGWARTNTEAVNTPSGYTLLEAGVAGIGSGANLAVFGKICTSSETAPTISFSGTGRHQAVMAVMRSSTGWPTITTAADIVVNTTENRTSTNAGCSAYAITPGEDNCMVFAVNGKATTSNDTTSVATPSGYTNAVSYIRNNATDGGIIVGWFLGQTTATALSSASAAISPTDDTGRRDQISLALRGAAVVLTKKLKLLANSSAASATGVAGVVFSAPTGTNITGTTRYGEFTGKTFESALESGKAVLKVPVADFGGTALTTASTPVALVRNTINTTGIVSCTVIEE